MKRPGESPSLVRVQRWMQAVIMHPDGVEAGIDSPVARAEIDVVHKNAEAVIPRSQRQTSIERLQIYANAYYARLLEVLSAEFPALTQAVGEEVFQGFAFGYLQDHPSQSYTLSDLGSHFPDYLSETRPPREADEDSPDWADFLVDLARLERIYSEVFDGPGVEGQRLLQSEDIAAIASATEWSNARLVPVPCLRLLCFQFPVHEYVTAVRHDEQLQLPEPSPTRLVVTRRDFIVRRVAVDQSEFAALSSLVAGGTIAECLVAAEAEWSGQPDELAAEVRRWFRDWSAAGYFHRLQIG